jgi:hypothetical protein
MARLWHGRRKDVGTRWRGWLSAWPTVRSARRNHHIVAKARTRRGSVWMSGLDGPTALAVRCFEHQGVVIARYGGVTWACGKRGSWRAGRSARPPNTVLASNESMRGSWG